MERATSLAAFFITITFTFLTRASVLEAGYGASSKYCKGSLITDGQRRETYSTYVAHVLAELATVTPTKPGFAYGVVFPNDNPGSVMGSATCDGTKDTSRCITCLSGIQQLLTDSCGGEYEGGTAKGGLICGMVYGIVP